MVTQTTEKKKEKKRNCFTLQHSQNESDQKCLNQKVIQITLDIYVEMVDSSVVLHERQITNIIFL